MELSDQVSSSQDLVEIDKESTVLSSGMILVVEVPQYRNTKRSKLIEHLVLTMDTRVFSHGLQYHS